MSITKDDLIQRLMALVDNDELVLPTLPEVALRVREVANDPDVSPRALSDLLASDPAISARLIRVANSPLMRSLQRIDTLPNAISRLGISYSCNLAIGLAMAQMFQATSEVIDERMRHAWKHSIEVAAIATVLAQHYTRLKPDQATLAALVHQIGVLPVLAYAEENDLLVAGCQSGQLDALITAAHPVIGEKILRVWNFPDALLAVPSEHVKLHREAEAVDYVDVVIVAKLLSRSENSLAESQWQSVSAFSRLGLRPSRDILEAQGLSEEMQAAASALDDC